MPPMSDPAFDGLDPEQRLVVEALRGPVVVLAGAGTGKTRAITHRIAHAVGTGTHAASTGLAVTFTNRAAGEMRQRLASLGVPGVAVRTFHSAALSQLRHFWPVTVGGAFPKLVPSKASMVAEACRETGMPTGRPLVRDLAAEIEWAGSSLVAAGDYAEAAAAAGRSPLGSGSDVVDLPGIARVMLAYQQVKLAANAIDFEDVLLTMIAIVGDRPDVADEIRRRYRWFTVDEYQDITPAQDLLLSSWLGERDDVCVVGDASQTIYSFAGARADSLGRFARRWPNATEVRLDRCYRCTPQIVTVANAVLRSAQRIVDQPVSAEPEMAGEQATRAVESGESSAPESAPRSGDPVGAPAVMLRSQRDPGPVPEIVACADDGEEAAAVVARIRGLLEGGLAPRDIAILMRTNGASEPFEVALAEAGIGYVMRGAERFFERPEVREAMVRLRGQSVAAPDPTPTLGQGEPLVEQVEAVLAGMGWLASGPASGGATRERWESLAALLALSREVAASGCTNAAGLVAEFERRAELSHAPTADGVTVTTLHSAKGLEWSAVFIVGASEGSLPIVHADTPARLEEERRLFYVGVTRARDHLVISWAMTWPGAGRHREPSRFLAALRSRGRAEAATGTSGLVRRGVSKAPEVQRRQPAQVCRSCGARLVGAEQLTLGRCSQCPGQLDEQVLGAVQRWRAGVAAEQGVPERAVLRDLTVQAIAERRPATEADLAAIPEFRAEKLHRYGPQVLEAVAGSPLVTGAVKSEVR